MDREAECDMKALSVKEPCHPSDSDKLVHNCLYSDTGQTASKNSAMPRAVAQLGERLGRDERGFQRKLRVG